MLSPQISIFSRYQFPSLDTATTTANQQIGLCYGLGWGLFTSSEGKAFFKEGHDDGWGHFFDGAAGAPICDYFDDEQQQWGAHFQRVVREAGRG
jgi:hypothetical protein